MTERNLAVLESIPSVQNPEELRDFLNKGAIYDIDYRLQLANKGISEKSFSIKEDEKEFAVYWLQKATKRFLVIQNSLSRLPGLFLNIPVDLEEYKVAPGKIGASYIGVDRDGHRVPEPYTEDMPIVGSPQAAVKVIIVAAQELSVASGIVTPKDI